MKVKATFTIGIEIEKNGHTTSVHVEADKGADPGAILDIAITALLQERAELGKCPVHKKKVPHHHV